VSFDPTSGHEQRGRRLVLIISPEEFNKKTGLLSCFQLPVEVDLLRP
jgi:mRNA-degrading endonuclease toxin of MazEF toxin-antitoxin module